MKRKLSVVFFACIWLIACSTDGESSATGGHQAQAASIETPGQSTYRQYCKLCHGNRGDLGLSGAANLRTSSLSLEERIAVITNGRNGMAAHKGILSPEEIKEVAEYLELLHE